MPGQSNYFPLLLQEIRPDDANKMCIVIDLDETLVHSSFKVSALNMVAELHNEVPICSSQKQ